MKKIFLYSLAISFSICIYALTFAEEFGNVNFPEGSVSFADIVVSYSPTAGVKSPFNDPNQALGPPNFTSSDKGDYVALGDEGTLIVKFTDNSLTTSGDETLDLWIFEIGGAIEPTEISISTDGTNWINVGHAGGSTSGIDIDSYIDNGVIPGEKYSYVLLRDMLPHQSGSPDTGADIDAIGAISSSSPVHDCIDSDKDGVIDEWDQCPDTKEGSWINSSGCPATGLYTEEQMNQMVSSILLWGDINGDNKISLIEAIKALRVTSGITEPAIKNE